MIPWIIGSFFYMYELVLRVCTGVMVDGLRQDFGLHATALGFINSCYYYAYVPLQIPCGFLVDRFGVRSVIGFSSLLCTSGIFLFSVASHVTTLELSRLIIGAGSACAFVSCLRLSISNFDAKKFALFAGITNALGTAGGCLGGYPIARCVEAYGWRQTCFVLGIVGTIITLFCFTFITTYCNETQSANKKALKKDFLSLVKNPFVIWCGVIGCLLYLPISVLSEFWITPFLKGLFSHAGSATSLGGTMIFSGMAIGGILYPILFKGQTIYQIITKGALLSTMMFCITVSLIRYLNIYVVLSLLFLSGITIGAQVLCFSLCKERVPEPISTTALSLVNAIIMLGGLIFQPLFGYVLDFMWNGTAEKTDHLVRAYTPDSYQMAMFSVPLCLFLSFIILKATKALKDSKSSKN